MIKKIGQWLWWAVLASGCALTPVQAQDEPVLRVEAAAHVAPIRQLAVDPSEKWAVTVSDDKTARVWNLETQEMRSVLRVPIGAAKVGSLYAAAISPSGDEVAIAGTTGSDKRAHRIYLFSLKNASLTGAIDALAGDIKHLVWTPDGKYLIASYAGAHGFRVFDREGRVLRAESFPGPSYGAAVSSDGRIAIPAFDGSIRFFKYTGQAVEPTGRIQLPIADPVSVSFSPDGNHLAVGYYSRNGNDQVQVDVLDVRGMQGMRSFTFSDVRYGNLMHVAWSRDGSTLHAGGTGYREAQRFLIKSVGWPSGDVSELAVAANSITRLVAMAKGRLGFSTFEPSWGVIQNGQVTKKHGLVVPAVKNATSLKIHPDGRVVSWQATNSEKPTTFDLGRRRLLAAVQKDLQGPSTFSFLHFRSMVWEDTRNPKVNGVPIALAPEEVARAAALLPDDSAALLGTSWNLRKLDKAGKELWKVPVATEVKALNVTQDSRTIVMALVDGSIHWLRASDGMTLLTLIMTTDGRWVLVSPTGHYDASAGAESLLGWQVDRPDGLTSDFFPISKFRDRLYRPDVIDQGLRFGSPEESLAAANLTLGREAAAVGGESVQSAARLMRPSAMAQQEFPPVLRPAGDNVAHADEATTKVSFAVFSHSGAPVQAWQVKVNGRPVQSFVVEAPAHADGRSLGQLALARPAETAKIQLFASNQFGVSEPLTIDVVGSRKAGGDVRPQDKRPNLYVLAVGVARYANSDLDLLFPAKDARDIAEVLRKQEGGRYKNVFSRTVTDADATQQAIANGLKWLKDTATAEDVSILFIAGHGVTMSGNLYRFLPHDADLAKPAETLITEDQIRDALVNIKGKAVLFIDTCFSGKATGRFTRHDTKLIANRLASAENGVIVFSSSDGSQESLEKEVWGNGAFTKELISGLNGKADFRHEGVVTHKGLDYYVSHQVKELTSGLQTPVTTVPIGIPDYPLTQHTADPPEQAVSR